jgi:hypothetical protein
MARAAPDAVIMRHSAWMRELSGRIEQSGRNLQNIEFSLKSGPIRHLKRTMGRRKRKKSMPVRMIYLGFFKAQALLYKSLR